MVVATFERVEWWMVLLAIGLAGVVIFPLGELLGWWDQLGEWGLWLSIFLSLAMGLVAASRFQVIELRKGVRELGAGLSRVETGVARVEANTAGLPVAVPEMVRLLTEIRDALNRRRE